MLCYQLTVEASESEISSIELQLVRVETVCTLRCDAACLRQRLTLHDTVCLLCPPAYAEGKAREGARRVGGCWLGADV